MTYIYISVYLYQYTYNLFVISKYTSNGLIYTIYYKYHFSNTIQINLYYLSFYKNTTFSPTQFVPLFVALKKNFNSIDFD